MKDAPLERSRAECLGDQCTEDNVQLLRKTQVLRVRQWQRMFRNLVRRATPPNSGTPLSKTCDLTS